MNFDINARLLNEAQELEYKWSETGLLRGLRNRAERLTTAVLLENQRLVNEAATDTSDIAQFKKISIPLVRRIFPQLVANKIVSVQPLLGPVGLVYYLRFRYSSNKGAMRGASLQGGYPSDDMASLQQVTSGDVNLHEYYSSQFVQNESLANSGGGTSLTYSLEHTPLLTGTLVGTIYDGGTAIQTFSTNQSNAFSFVDVGSPSPKVTAGSVNADNGVITFTWSGDPGANSVTLSYEYNLECNPDLPEINLVVENEEIVSKTRKLKAVWSYEAQQDLRSQQNLDAESELTAVLAQEINLEIDREVLGDLRANAGTVSTWDYSLALGDTIKEKYESLFVKLVEISNVVQRKTLRGGCNWIVCSPEVASIFETATAGFAPTPSENFTTNLGVQYIGTVNNRWRLYKDPAFPVNQLLMGYRGDSYLDSGYFYCPYVPLVQSPVVLDPHSLCPRKGLMTRYGKKMLRDGQKFYARLNIANFVV